MTQKETQQLNYFPEGLEALANDMNEMIVKNATCSYKGCNEPTHSNSVCKAHYAELRYPATDDEQ